MAFTVYRLKIVTRGVLEKDTLRFQTSKAGADAESTRIVIQRA